MPGELPSSPLSGMLPVVVCDTNLLLDWFVWDEPSVRALREMLEEGRFRAVTSADAFDELPTVLDRPEFGLSKKRRAEITQRWRSLSEEVPVMRGISAVLCRDTGDQKFLDLAFSSGAQWLLTRDKDLLKLAKKVRSRGLTVCRPDEALGRDFPWGADSGLGLSEPEPRRRRR